MSRNTIPSAIADLKDEFFSFLDGDLKELSEEEKDRLDFQIQAFEKMPESALTGQVAALYDNLKRQRKGFDIYNWRDEVGRRVERQLRLQHAELNKPKVTDIK